MKWLSRPVLIALGWMFVGLGFIGIFLPVMPTTVFLLIAAWCFVRSSERLHRWLVEHHLFGPFIRDYLAGKGMPLRAKVVALSMMWGAIGSSAWFFVPHVAGDAVLLSCGALGTFMILRQPTRAPEAQDA